MTEQIDTTATPEQLDRIARLRASRGQTTPTPDTTPDTTSPDRTSPDITGHTGRLAPPAERGRKRHVARTSRVVAGGLGATAIIGLIGSFGLANPFVTTTDPEIDAVTPRAAVAPPPIRVVVHRIPAARPAVPVSSPAADPTADAGVDRSPEPPPAPIVLTANPVVQTVTVAAPRQASASAPAAPAAPAASATTSGSK